LNLNPFVIGASYVVLNDSTILARGVLPTRGPYEWHYYHERGDIEQARQLGVGYVPIYVGLAIAAFAAHPGTQHNFIYLEQQADRYADRFGARPTIP
jgi:hypothetical protein